MAPAPINLSSSSPKRAQVKNELAMRLYYVHRARSLVRVMKAWKAYTDQIQYPRKMLLKQQMLRLLQRCFRSWSLSVKREIQLRIIFQTNQLKAMWRTMRLWATLAKTRTRCLSMAMLCFSSWRFHTDYKSRLYQDFAALVGKYYHHHFSDGSAERTILPERSSKADANAVVLLVPSLYKEGEGVDEEDDEEEMEGLSQLREKIRRRRSRRRKGKEVEEID